MKKQTIIAFILLLCMLSACASSNISKKHDSHPKHNLNFSDEALQLATNITSPCYDTPNDKLTENLKNHDKYCLNAHIWVDAIHSLLESGIPAEQLPKYAESFAYTLSHPQKINTIDRPRLGSPTAPFECIVYSDFQCPYCKIAAQNLHKLYSNASNDFTIVFKHLPLSIHKYAAPAAFASQIAHVHGKFWEFHDFLFENQHTIDTELITTFFLQNMKMDISSIPTSELESYAQPLLDDFNEANLLEIGGVPTIFINGIRLELSTTPFLLQYASASTKYFNIENSQPILSNPIFPHNNDEYEKLSTQHKQHLLAITKNLPCNCKNLKSSLYTCAQKPETCPDSSSKMQKIIDMLKQNIEPLSIYRIQLQDSANIPEIKPTT